MADRALNDYERGCADERARIAWWLRAGAAGPAAVSRPDEARWAADLADVIENHPDRFADAPTGRPAKPYPCYCSPGPARCDDPYNWCDRSQP